MSLSQNQRGMSLVSVLIGLGVGTIALMGLLSVGNMVIQSQSGANAQGVVQDARNQILGALQNETSFQNTLRHSDNALTFACINSATDCTGAGGEFKIFDQYNQRLEYATLTSETRLGFTRRGTSCSTFDPGLGTAGCPFKYVASWNASCPPVQNIQGRSSIETLCRNPIIEIHVTFHFKPGTDRAGLPIINPEKASIHLAKSQIESDARKLCQMLNGGTYVGSTCILPGRANSTCEQLCGTAPDGTPLQGFSRGLNDDGTPRCSCTMTVAQDCNVISGVRVGRVLLGIANNGVPLCGDGIAPVLRGMPNWNLAPQNFGGN